MILHVGKVALDIDKCLQISVSDSLTDRQIDRQSGRYENQKIN